MGVSFDFNLPLSYSKRVSGVAAEQDASPVFSTLVQSYMSHCSLGQTSCEILAAVSDARLRSDDLAPIFHANPAYENFLLKMEILRKSVERWSEEEKAHPELNRVLMERVLRLLGKEATRNAVLCMRLNRLARVDLPRKPGDPPKLEPARQLKYALAAEELCRENQWLHPDSAFQAGLHFDWIEAMMTSRKAPADARKYLDVAWKDALKTARIAYLVGSKLKQFALEKYAFAGGALVHVGRPWMAISFPKSAGAGAWLAFLAECEKHKQHASLVFRLQEKSRFGLLHNEAASLWVSALGLFPQIRWAVHHYQEPFYIQSRSREQYQLANVLCVAEGIAQGKARLSPIQERAASEIKLTEKQIAEILKSVGSDKKEA